MITNKRNDELKNSTRDWLDKDYKFNQGTHWTIHFDSKLQREDDSYNIERLMRKFLRRLDRSCYKKQRNRVERINVIEGIGSLKNNHCHLLLNTPSHLTNDQFTTNVIESIEKTSKYHSRFFTLDRQKIKEMDRTGRYFGFGEVHSTTIENQWGLLDYLKKEVGISDDCIDINNSRLGRRT